ncbi:hypothetical protein CIC12_15510 [Burkholderia sp. SG-MS1]|nr:hypothetical protein [Paraburkholderia sp. SG-MS1]
MSRAVSFIARITAVTTHSDKAHCRESALDYHEIPTPGRLAIIPAKQMSKQRERSARRQPRG